MKKLAPLVARRWRPVIAGALVVATILAGTLAYAPVARAVIPVTDYAHIVQTILHYFARLQQIANQVEQIERAVEQIENQVKALEKLDAVHLRDVETVMREITGVLSGHQFPSHVSPSVRNAHAETYKGWELPLDWWEEEEVAVDVTLKTLKETLWAKHLQHRTTMEQLETLGDIKEQLDDIEGHEEALELLATLGAYETEAQLLAQLSAQTSADAATAYYSYEVNRRARQEVSIQEAIRTSLQTPQPPGNSPGWAPLPNWWTGRAPW